MPTARIVYASTHGQTEKIAGYMAGRLRAQGVDGKALDIQAAERSEQWMPSDLLLIGGSVYVRRFQRVLDAFIRQHRAALNAHPNAVFFSVSASAANEQGREAVAALVTEYLDAVGWQPADRADFAGAVKYPRYGLITRWVMQRISRKEGGGIDTRYTYEYTDWNAVDDFLSRCECFERPAEQDATDPPGP